MRTVFGLVSGIANVFGYRLAIRPENGSLVTDSISINGESLALIIDINSADLIVPICSDSTFVNNCFDPSLSGSFRYCKGDSYCYDRQLPPFSCPQTVPSSEWSIDTSAKSDHKRVIDGATITFKTFEFSESVGVGGKQISSVPIKGSVNFPKGILGLGPQRLSCRSNTLLSSINTTRILLDIDEIDLSPRDALSNWTEVYQTIPTNASMIQGKYAFNMYNPTVCGVDLLGATSSRWTTIIDTSVECLMLPYFMHENLKAWKAGSDGFLYFAISSDEHAGYARIKLEGLCIQSKSPPIAGSGFPGLDPIVLGFRALQSLGPISLETAPPYRISLSTTTQPSTDCKVSPSQCFGGQKYDRATNECVNPDCGAYLFSQLDASRMVCDWKSYVPFALYTTIVFLFLGELVVWNIRRKATAIAQEACDRNVES
jgi:hypothetical protein